LDVSDIPDTWPFLCSDILDNFPGRLLGGTDVFLVAMKSIGNKIEVKNLLKRRIA
jgi:hypothetical protein